LTVESGHPDRSVVVRLFHPEDQISARTLILAGLGEHFGSIDKTLNRDLDDIGQTYLARGHLFLVAIAGDCLVGTGALVRIGTDRAELVRISVHPGWRRRGVGRILVRSLEQQAVQRGVRRIEVETNDDWHDAIGFYLRCGYQEYARDAGSVYLAREFS
jgi:GNAT superfamily N-acetyltransferase